MYSLRRNHIGFIKNNKLIPKSQQKFRSENLTGVTEITYSDNNDNRIQTIDSLEILNRLNVTI